MIDFDELVQRVRNGDTAVPALQDLAFICQSCEQEHRGLFDLSQYAPSPYLGATDEQRSRFKLSSDLCRNNMSGDCFVRGVLPLPIHGTDAVFSYGVWSTLSKDNFQIYLETWDDDQSSLGPWFGWFSNSLKGYPPTMKLKVQVHPQPDGKRPVFELEPTDHPLAIEQRDGISIDRVLEIYAANGHGPMAGQPPKAPARRWWPFG